MVPVVVDDDIPLRDLELGGDPDARDGDVDEQDQYEDAPFEAADEGSVQGDEGDAVDDDLQGAVDLECPDENCVAPMSAPEHSNHCTTMEAKKKIRTLTDSTKEPKATSLGQLLICSDIPVFPRNARQKSRLTSAQSCFSGSHTLSPQWPCSTATPAR